MMLVVCVCLEVVEFVYPLFVMIQGQMNLNAFEKKIYFLKKVKIQPFEMLIQSVVLHLVDFEKDLKI